MNKAELKTLIKEEIKNLLKEEYQDQYQLSGMLTTDTTQRPQSDILSDIRSLSGVTVVSTEDLDDTPSTQSKRYNTILNLKIDGYPFIKKGGFSKDTIDIIIDSLKKIPNVVTFTYNPEDITSK